MSHWHQTAASSLAWDSTDHWCKWVQPHLLRWSFVQLHSSEFGPPFKALFESKDFPRHYPCLKKQTHGIYILHFVFNISCKLFLALQESISEHILKNYFLCLARLDFYQYKTISIAPACYALTANTIKAVTRCFRWRLFITAMVAEKELIWAEWAEGRKGCSGVHCSLHSLPFPESIKLPACTCSTYPTILSGDSLQHLDSEILRDEKAIWVHTGLPFPPMVSHFGSSQLQQRSFPPLSPPTRPHRTDTVAPEWSLLFCSNCSCTNWAGHFLDAEEGTKVQS